MPLSSPESIVQCRYVASEPEPERSLQAAAKAAAKADEERMRIAVTEALELKKSELERELKENDLNRQQKAELNRQLKVTLGELAAASRPENRWTKCGAEALVASCSREASKTMGGDEGSEEADRILLLALLVRAPAF